MFARVWRSTVLDRQGDEAFEREDFEQAVKLWTEIIHNKQDPVL